MRAIWLVLLVSVCWQAPVIANTADDWMSDVLLAASDDRKDKRDERGRSDERHDKRDCRQEEGVVGDDKRECKQEEVRDGVRGNKGGDDDED
ncbi:MAG: hypothetical protein O3A63_05480 [Proteobacteria bacterium]|nr:hypothetical protein [Pseudomonadota bacterium]